MHKVLSKSVAAELTDLRAASTAGGGTALNTTSVVIELPFGSSWVDILPRNFVTAVVAQIALCPRLTIITTQDLLATTAKHTGAPALISTFPTQDISDEMQDGDATNFAVDAIDTFANGDAIYVGASVPFRGVGITLGDVNSATEVLTVKYPDKSGNWTDISDSDGTQTGGDTSLGQAGDVTWTVPEVWTAFSLNKLEDTVLTESWAKANLFWTRWEFTGALSASVDIRTMIGLNKSTAYLELIEGKPLEFAVDTDATAAIEALVDAGTGNLVVNVAVLDPNLTGKKEVLP